MFSQVPVKNLWQRMWPTLQPVWQHRPSSKCLHPDFLGISKAVRGPRPSAKGWLERKGFGPIRMMTLTMMLMVMAASLELATAMVACMLLMTMVLMVVTL